MSRTNDSRPNMNPAPASPSPQSSPPSTAQVDAWMRGLVDDAALASDRQAIAVSRQAAQAELAARPKVSSWRQQAAVVTAIGLGVTLVGTWVTAAVGGPARGLFGARLPALVLLWVAQALALWGAIRPGRWNGRVWAWGAATSGAALLVHARSTLTFLGAPMLYGADGAAIASQSAGWICSLSHLAVGIAPAVVIVATLRQVAWSLSRALTAGMAVGVSGLIWGEIACERSLFHVVVHHFGALILMVMACTLATRWFSRRGFAP